MASCAANDSVSSPSFYSADSSSSLDSSVFSSLASDYDCSLSDMVSQSENLLGDERIVAGALIEGRLRGDGYIKPITHRRAEVMTRVLHAERDFWWCPSYEDAVATNEAISQQDFDGLYEADISSRTELESYLARKGYTLKESVVVSEYYSDPSELAIDVRYFGASGIFPATMNRGLFIKDRKGNLRGDLASSFTVISPREMEITLAEGFWHKGNGEISGEISAQNFLDAYTYARSNLSRYYPFVTDIKAKDDRTLIVTVTNNVAAVPSVLFEMMNYPFFAPVDPSGQVSEELLYSGHYSYEIVDGTYILDALDEGVAPRIEIRGDISSAEAFLSGSLDFVKLSKNDDGFPSVFASTGRVCAAVINPRCEVGDERYQRAIGNLHFRRAIMGALKRGDLVAVADPNGIKFSTLSTNKDWKSPSDVPLFGVTAEAGMTYGEISDKYAQEDETNAFILQELEQAKSELGEEFFATPVLLPLCWSDWLNADFALAVIEALKVFADGMVEIVHQEPSYDFFYQTDYVSKKSFIYLFDTTTQDPILLGEDLLKLIIPGM